MILSELHYAISIKRIDVELFFLGKHEITSLLLSPAWSYECLIKPIDKSSIVITYVTYIDMRRVAIFIRNGEATYKLCW